MGYFILNFRHFGWRAKAWGRDQERKEKCQGGFLFRRFETQVRKDGHKSLTFSPATNYCERRSGLITE